jgi:3-hydroxyisobutyrate dehydrogenase
MCCVGNDNDLREVTLGRQQAFSGMGKGKVFVDHTTASAEIARTLRSGEKRSMVDAPVSAARPAGERSATVMCGGDAGPFSSAEKVIAAYAKACNLMGAPGSGQLAKMCNQICIAGLVQAWPKPSLRQEGRSRHRN